MFHPEPGDLPSDDVLDTLAHAHQARLLELLTVCEQFLRTASPTVHNELRTFLTAQGYHPVAGLPAFLDALIFTVTQPPDRSGAS